MQHHDSQGPCVPNLVRRQAAATPYAPALIDDDRTLSYTLVPPIWPTICAPSVWDRRCWWGSARGVPPTGLPNWRTPVSTRQCGSSGRVSRPERRCILSAMKRASRPKGFEPDSDRSERGATPLDLLDRSRHPVIGSVVSTAARATGRFVSVHALPLARAASRPRRKNRAPRPPAARVASDASGMPVSDSAPRCTATGLDESFYLSGLGLSAPREYGTDDLSFCRSKPRCTSRLVGNISRERPGADPRHSR